VSDFRAAVYALVEQIPEGRVMSYGDLAAAAGSPRAARQVGYALAALPPDRLPDVPWHRVINARGRISGRGDSGRAEVQEHLLAAESVTFDASGRCDFERLRWFGFGEHEPYFKGPKG
jgi:methylated-DNA-protein-cysteine methyltransferase-like protein